MSENASTRRERSERFKISNVAKFESDSLKTKEEIV